MMFVYFIYQIESMNQHWNDMLKYLFSYLLGHRALYDKYNCGMENYEFSQSDVQCCSC